MKAEGTFVLLTHFGTILCVNRETNKLEHLSPDSCPFNLLFQYQGNYLIPLVPPAESGYSVNDVLAAPIKFERVTDQKIRLIHRGHYLTSEKNSSAINNNRSLGSLWEEFCPIPVVYFRNAVATAQTLSPSFTISRQSGIPKTIHQIYLSTPPGRGQIPSDIQAGINTMMINNPGWRHHIWTGDEIPDLISEWYGHEALKCYLAVNPLYASARADLFRYMCIHKLGGVYLDLNTKLTKPLDDIIHPNDQYLLSHCHCSNAPIERHFNAPLPSNFRTLPGGGYQNFYIMAAVSHPFLSAVLNSAFENIKNYSSKIFGVGNEGVLRVTGEIVYSLAIEKIRRFHIHRIFNAEHEGISCKTLTASSADLPPHPTTLTEDVVA
jgi:hypothetical protein